MTLSKNMITGLKPIAARYMKSLAAEGIRAEYDDILAELALQCVVSKKAYESSKNHSASLKTYINRSMRNRMIQLANDLKTEQARFTDILPEQAHEESPWFAWDTLDQVNGRDRIFLKELVTPSPKVAGVMKAQRAQTGRDSWPKAVALVFGITAREVWDSVTRVRRTMEAAA